MRATDSLENGMFSVIEGQRYCVWDVSFSDIRWKCGTGRHYTEKKNAGNRVTHYRSGVETAIGDIEESVWYQVARAVIEREGELDLLNQLKQWCAEQICWLRNPREVEEYALKLHISRIFDNPRWVDFKEFNEKYRPEALESQNLGLVSGL